ncbi:MAG TPA: VOC family protein [Rhizomicrobium sp.]
MKIPVINAIGKIDQVGFVVDDLREAVNFWANRCGVGPFFVMEHVPYDKFTYFDKDSDVDLGLAFSYVGSLQIELIFQHNDTPSVYTTLKKTAPNGLVHMARYTDDLDAASSGLKRNGAKVIQYSLDDKGVETIYLDTDLHNGGLIEFIKVREVHKRRRGLIQKAVQQWDGTNPYRRIDNDNPFAAADS